MTNKRAIVLAEITGPTGVSDFRLMTPGGRLLILTEADFLPLDARYANAFAEAARQVGRDRTAWPPYNSAHEGFAVIHEEFDELKAHVWTNQKRRDLAAMRQEALQLAACAIAFAADCCDDTAGRK